MQPERTVVGRAIYLGQIDRKDAPLYLRWVNDPRLQPLLNRPWEITEGEERDRVDTLVSADNAVGFAIHLRKDESLIGRSAIWNIHKVNRSGYFTIFIGEPTRWSMGHGREATALTTVYAMDVLKLNRLELEVFSYNDRAMRCYEGLGFTREGIRRESRHHDGVWHDAIQMGVLARDWKEGLRESFARYLDPAHAAGLDLPGASA